MKTYPSLLPLVAILATSGSVNAAVIPTAAVGDILEADIIVVNGATLAKRQNCWFDPFGFLFKCPSPARPTTTSSSAARISSTSPSASRSSSSSSFLTASPSTTSSTANVETSISATSSNTSDAVVTPVSTTSTAENVDTIERSSSSLMSSSSLIVSSIIESVSFVEATATSSATVTVVSTSTSIPTAMSPGTSSLPATPTPTNASVSGWRYAGDIWGGTNGRALVAASTAGSDMTIEKCLAYCDERSFPIAGVEYGGECYCGTVLSNGASLDKTATATMPCGGNVQQLCGGPNTLSLYVSTGPTATGLSTDLTSQAVTLPTGWSAASSPCIQEVAGRALVDKSFASDDMTIAKCSAFCVDFQYAGLEYGRECYCGNALQNGASLESTSGQCVVPCAGLSTNTCGGPNAIQLFTNANFKPVTSSSGDFLNTGCIQEVAGRALRGASTASPDMTIDKCTAFCAARSFSIAGLQYGAECYCDNEFQGGASASLWSGQCHMPCAGAGGENCGGPNAINVFVLTA